MASTELLRVPNFVTAGSLTGLRRAMLLNNSKRGVGFIYHDIQFVQGKWYAWFHDVMKPEDVRGQDLDDTSPNNRR